MAEELWGVADASDKDDMCVVCDDCFQKIHPTKFPELAEEARNELCRVQIPALPKDI